MKQPLSLYTYMQLWMIMVDLNIYFHCFPTHKYLNMAQRSPISIASRADAEGTDAEEVPQLDVKSWDHHGLL